MNTLKRRAELLSEEVCLFHGEERTRMIEGILEEERKLIRSELIERLNTACFELGLSAEQKTKIIEIAKSIQEAH